MPRIDKDLTEYPEVNGNRIAFFANNYGALTIGVNGAVLKVAKEGDVLAYTDGAVEVRTIDHLHYMNPDNPGLGYGARVDSLNGGKDGAAVVYSRHAPRTQWTVLRNQRRPPASRPIPATTKAAPAR